MAGTEERVGVKSVYLSQNIAFYKGGGSGGWHSLFHQYHHDNNGILVTNSDNNTTNKSPKDCVEDTTSSEHPDANNITDKVTSMESLKDLVETKIT